MAEDDGANNGQTEAPDGSQPSLRRATFTPAPTDAFQQFVAEKTAYRSAPIDAPPPNPSTIATPPPGSALPQPPQRKSLADDELLSSFDGEALRAGGALDAIEQLQKQLRIREQEAREFRSWESSMLAIGTPEALGVVEKTRSTFTEVIQVIPPSTAAPAEPITLPAVASEAVVAPETGEPTAAEPAVFDLVEPEDAPRTTGANILPPVLPSESEVDDDAPVRDSVTDVVPPAEPLERPSTEPGEIIVVPDAATPAQKVFSPESSGVEPTVPEQRTGRAIRLFWLWFAANSSVLSVAFGAVMLSLGMSLRQAIVAALAGVALSFLPIGLATLASKWNGQPTMVASRASFGILGNIVPSVLALVTRLLWGSVLLWLLASVTAQLLMAAGAGSGLSVQQLTIVSAGVGFLIALVVAFFGYQLFARVQLVLSVLSGMLIIVLIVVSWPLVDLAAALSIGDGPWVLVLTGAILVFSFVGLVWSTAGGDLARYQRPSGPGASSMLTASFGSAVPSFVLIVYGALIAASNPSLAFGFVEDPIATLTELVPAWFLVPLIAAVAIGLLSGVILSIYSGGFALLAITTVVRREPAVLAVGFVLGGIAVALALASADFTVIFRDLATTLAVPTAAWLGIFAAEIMIRNRRFDTHSLVQRGGLYPDVRWVNLSMLVVASAIGYGFTTASVTWLSWQGYLLAVAGIPLGSELARADLGVLVALALALLTPIVVGVPAIRRQEAARS